MNRSLIERLCGVAALAILSSNLVACGPDYDHTEITAVNGQGTLGAGIDNRHLDVAEGLVITAYVAVWDDDNEKMPLAIRSKRPDIVEVAGVVNPRNYTFVGLKEGKTEIEFLADGEVVLTIPATVSKQPAPGP